MTRRSLSPGRRTVLAAQPEAHFQRAITDLMDLHGWVWFHDNDPRKNNAGLPDLIACDGRTLVLWELKSEEGRLTRKQRRWHDLLDTAERLSVGVRRPTDWDDVASLIEGRR